MANVEVTNSDHDTWASGSDTTWHEAYAYLDRLIAHQDENSHSNPDDAAWQNTYDYLDRLISQLPASANQS